MGEAMVSALLARGIASPEEVAVCELLPQRRQHLTERYGVRTEATPDAVVPRSELVVLAVKPQEFEAAAASLRGRLQEGQTVLSIMAGIPLRAIVEGLAHQRAVRAMPNTPAQIGEGMTVWTATPQVDGEARQAVGRVLAALGRELYVEEEKYVDMATAVSASGPGFVFLLLEALIDGAVHIGFRREMATSLVLQTVLGSVRYAEKTGRHPAELRAQVTSPGGTTTEGVLALERGGVRAAIIEAIAAAYRKTQALGGK